MTVSALNFKPYDRGAMRGFFDLRYYGLTVRGCRLMSGNNGLWIALPQKEAMQDGERKYFDQMYLTAPEMEHVRRMVLADLQAQGHLDHGHRDGGGQGGNHQHHNRPAKQGGGHRTPEGEDVSQYYTQPGDDGIPF
ncbi:hypothetical protein [Desulfosarcina ovata]|uniref:SpoVG family protein n=1 Tax=Desulfosarcina ovata subsp. ovata TaxID=2752305 RepID=A0A5K8A6P4_9BACT|nr:hypothetical protein [Desulfosarcina ovata]BBO88187.1 hypothetical protein DSCOOX_13670 [Desulfosarcina ovata subsp. ovata]